MDEMLTLILAWASGMVLGAIFFGGLWWAIGKGIASKQPAVWFFGSLLLRVSIVLVGFYFVGAGNWQRLLLCMLGFFMTKIALICVTCTLAKTHAGPPQEVRHAP
jgi:F1F0 ATPase subunit 2